MTTLAHSRGWPDRAPAAPALSLRAIGARLDFLFLSFVFFTATGALSRFGVDTPAWLAIYAGACFFFLRDFESLLDGVRGSWLALVVPLVAGLSTLWSVSSGQTLYSAFQLTMTVLIALWIGRRFTLREIFAALTIGCGIGVGLSILNMGAGVLPAWMGPSLIGIYTQKNVLAKVVMLFFVGASVLALASRRFTLFFAALFGSFVLVVLANSTSTLGFFAFTLAAPILWALGRGRPAERVLHVGYVAFLGIATLLFIVFGFSEVIDAALAAFEKDSTLTGRTVLWAYAGEITAARPWLGVGFNAFWDPDINSIVRLIRETVDERIRGFHNVYLEVRVALGWLGFALFLVFLAAAFSRALRAFVADGSMPTAAALMLTTLTIVIGFVENVMFRQHEVFQILIVALFAATAPDRASGRRAARLGDVGPGADG